MLSLCGGTPVIVTHNQDLAGLVNGTRGIVQAISPHGVLLQVSTSQHVLHKRAKWVQYDGGSFLSHAFDITYGYGTTVHKAQGATLSEGIVIFDPFAPEGWGYTVLTRFRRRDKVMLIGTVTPNHFAPHHFLKRSEQKKCSRTPADIMSMLHL